MSKSKEIIHLLELNPVIAAVDCRRWEEACNSPAAVLFLLGGEIADLKEYLERAERKGKKVFVHIDLIEGLGKDQAGVKWLAASGAFGLISTRVQLIKYAEEAGLATVQRFFALDSKGLMMIEETLAGSKADLIELMPGVIPKVIKRFAEKGHAVIAGGLIETKSEVYGAMKSGALAVSTGKSELWNE